MLPLPEKNPRVAVLAIRLTRSEHEEWHDWADANGWDTATLVRAIVNERVKEWHISRQVHSAARKPAK